MAKKWRYFSTNYSEAWKAFRKSKEYDKCNRTLQDNGIKQPYRNNILKEAFAAGWNASGVKIEIINH